MSGSELQDEHVTELVHWARYKSAIDGIRIHGADPPAAAVVAQAGVAGARRLLLNEDEVFAVAEDRLDVVGAELAGAGDLFIELELEQELKILHPRRIKTELAA